MIKTWITIKNTLSLIALLCIGLTLAEDVFACSCPPVSHYTAVSVPLATTNADYVFLGRVTNIVPWAESADGFIEFEPIQWWVAPATVPTSVKIRLNGSLCDIYFDRGENAVIYAHGSDEEQMFVSNSCMLMTRTESIEEEVAILNAIDFSNRANWSQDYFAYGCGGGVAVRYDLSVVYRDGRISHSLFSPVDHSEDTFSFTEPDPVFAEEVFRTLAQLDLDSIDTLNEPASYTCYLEVSVGFEIFRATWGGGEGKLPHDLEALGNSLRSSH